jgi:hypothetical protein
MNKEQIKFELALGGIFWLVILAAIATGQRCSREETSENFCSDYTSDAKRLHCEQILQQWEEKVIAPTLINGVN